MINKKALIAGVALALTLTGCGSKSGNAEVSGANEAAVQQDQQPAAQGGKGNPGMANRTTADLVGKVKSIDGNTITVNKSSFTPGQGGGARGGNGMRKRQSGDGQQPADGEQTVPADGQQPADQGQQPAPPADGQQPQDDGQPPAGGGRGQMNFENMFTDETTEITVTDSTKIIKREFVDNQMQETELTLVDLKADDIVSIDLTDGTQEAATITIGMGGFGGGFGRGEQGGHVDRGVPDDAPQMQQ